MGIARILCIVDIVECKAEVERLLFQMDLLIVAGVVPVVEVAGTASPVR